MKCQINIGFFILLVTGMVGCNKPIKIIPLSPYKYLTCRHIDYIYAIDNFSYAKKCKAIVDSFVLTHIDTSEIKQRKQSVSVSFYEYEKGVIDENFRHIDKSLTENLFQPESRSCLLIKYEWNKGYFHCVVYNSWSMFAKYNEYSSKYENRNW